MEIAERIRRAVAEKEFEVETAAEPIRATVSIGVAGFPKDGIDANELIHQADLAVYRAKRRAGHEEDTANVVGWPSVDRHELDTPSAQERRSSPKPRTLHGPT